MAGCADRHVDERRRQVDRPVAGTAWPIVARTGGVRKGMSPRGVTPVGLDALADELNGKTLGFVPPPGKLSALLRCLRESAPFGHGAVAAARAAAIAPAARPS